MKAGSSESAMIASLRRRFALPEWALFPGVRNGAGFNATRTADALAMNLWPSRGLELLGFEIKVSRGDWLKELRAPDKAEDMFAYCDRWYIVAGSRELVKDGELPPTWGLLVPRGDTLEMAKEAPRNYAMPLNRGLVAVLAKRIMMQDPDRLAIAAAVEAQREELTRLHEDGLKYERDARKAAEKELYELKRSLGASYHGAEEIAEAVRLILSGGATGLARALDRLLPQLAEITERVKKSRVGLEAVLGVTEVGP